MEEKTVKSMNLAFMQSTERLYVLISKQMKEEIKKRAKKDNMKESVVVRLALAEYLTK
ncbi:MULTISPECIES: hypothetical protein [Bacteroidales]|uniref:hypothetical protein n=1 Tax=Bacteroidales TaxID=171549 RepID=UPI0025FCC060|nr:MULTISPECIES: hypothetical protein [Bacteroidales]